MIPFPSPATCSERLRSNFLHAVRTTMYQSPALKSSSFQVWVLCRASAHHSTWSNQRLLNCWQPSHVSSSKLLVSLTDDLHSANRTALTFTSRVSLVSISAKWGFSQLGSHLPLNFMVAPTVCVATACSIVSSSLQISTSYLFLSLLSLIYILKRFT